MAASWQATGASNKPSAGRWKRKRQRVEKRLRKGAITKISMQLPRPVAFRVTLARLYGTKRSTFRFLNALNSPCVSLDSRPNNDRQVPAIPAPLPRPRTLPAIRKPIRPYTRGPSGGPSAAQSHPGGSSSRLQGR